MNLINVSGSEKLALAVPNIRREYFPEQIPHSSLSSFGERLREDEMVLSNLKLYLVTL